jgi:hypothetical protein
LVNGYLRIGLAFESKPGHDHGLLGLGLQTASDCARKLIFAQITGMAAGALNDCAVCLAEIQSCAK